MSLLNSSGNTLSTKNINLYVYVLSQHAMLLYECSDISLFKARKVTLFKQNLGTNVLDEILMDLEGCVAVYGCVHVHSV